MKHLATTAAVVHLCLTLSGGCAAAEAATRGPDTAGRAPAADADGRSTCPPAQTPHLVLETGSGTIAVKLYPGAAPAAVGRLLALADEGYFDGLAFDYTRPRTELRSAERADRRVDLPSQMDARALGLHRQTVGDVGAAMDVVQQELLAAARSNKRNPSVSGQLEAWLAAWYEDRDAAFLVGTTRRQINEALGYVYQEGLASRPVEAGTVALVPREPATASPRLSIALRDLPRHTGRWMVVGRVAEGLDVAERIALRPLEQPRHIKPSRYAPAAPVAIESAHAACR